MKECLIIDCIKCIISVYKQVRKQEDKEKRYDLALIIKKKLWFVCYKNAVFKMPSFWYMLPSAQV